jgi:hypothetical protein
MTESFESPAMMQMINYLIEAGANLSFGSFLSQQVAAHGE